MKGGGKVKSKNERQKLVEQLKKMHEEQRRWQIAVKDETLDMDAVDALTLEQLKEVVKKLKR